MSKCTQDEFPSEFYGLMLENLQQALFLKDRQGRFLYVNERFCAMVGKTRNEVIGARDEDLFSPELAAKYRNDDVYVLSEQQAFEVIEENPGPEGEIRHVQVIKKPLHKGAILWVCRGCSGTSPTSLLPRRSWRKERDVCGLH